MHLQTQTRPGAEPQAGDQRKPRSGETKMMALCIPQMISRLESPAHSAGAQGKRREGYQGDTPSSLLSREGTDGPWCPLTSSPSLESRESPVARVAGCK